MKPSNIIAQVDGSGTVELKLPLTSDVNEPSVPRTILADGLTSVKLRLAARSKASIRLGAMTLEVKVTLWVGDGLEADSVSARHTLAARHGSKSRDERGGRHDREALAQLDDGS